MRAPVAAFALLAAASALAAEDVRYEVAGEPYLGFFAPAEGEAKGLVVIVHDWDGLTDYERERARMLSALGYDAFAVDVYGEGVRPESVEEKRAHSGALMGDRPELRTRLAAGMAEARERSAADGAVVMGYCFGGAAALEMARAAEAEAAGYASFHGGLKTPEGRSWTAESAPLLILHGAADESIPMSDVASLVEELEAAEATFTVEVYSGAPHGFTVFGSDRYVERADRESWEAFTDFLEERLGG